jgi:transposase
VACLRGFYGMGSGKPLHQQAAQRRRFAKTENEQDFRLKSVEIRIVAEEELVASIDAVMNMLEWPCCAHLWK